MALIKFAVGALSGTLEARVLSCAAAASLLSLKSNPRISPHHKGKCQREMASNKLTSLKWRPFVLQVFWIYFNPGHKSL